MHSRCVKLCTDVVGIRVYVFPTYLSPRIHAASVRVHNVTNSDYQYKMPCNNLHTMKLDIHNRICYVHALHKFLRVHVGATDWGMRTRGCSEPC
jgi:hypothetical protein